MLQSTAGILLSLVWALSWACQPIAGQSLDVSNGKDLKIPSAGGEPSFSLHIMAEGRKGVVIVQDEKGAKLQTLVCPLLRDNAEATQSEIAAVREQFVTGFITTDLDFDGHMDLAAIREFGAKWARYCVWLFDPTQHFFMKDFLAEQMELLTNLEPVKDGQVSSSGIGPANPWFARYRIAGAKGSRPERQLVPIYSCLVESMPEADQPYTIVTTRFENGKAVPEHQQAASLDMKAALDRCNLSAQAVTTLPALRLNRSNNRQQVSVKIGQAIIVTLQTIGAGQSGTPTISTPSIRFLGSSFPAEQNPGGPTQVHRFTPVEDGDGTIDIPNSDANASFRLMVHVTSK